MMGPDDEEGEVIAGDVIHAALKHAPPDKIDKIMAWRAEGKSWEVILVLLANDQEAPRAA